MAQQEDGLVDLLRSWNSLEAVPDIFAKPLTAKARQYELVGGMPEPAAAWCVGQDPQAARDAQNRILTAYLQAALLRGHIRRLCARDQAWAQVRLSHWQAGRCFLE